MVVLQFKRVFGWVVWCAAMLVLAGCSMQQRAASESFFSELPAPPLTHISAPPPVVRTAAADESASFVGQDYTAQSGDDNQNLAGGAYQLGPAQGAVAWARYSAALPATHRLSGVSLQINAPALGGTPPEGPYYLALANYARNVWEWSGPYTSTNVSYTVGSSTPRAAYASPADQMHCLVLNYCPAGQTPQPLAVVSTRFDYTDGAASPGWATYTYIDGVYRIEAQVGAQPENVSLLLDAISPVAALEDSFLNISPDGQWLALITNRFDPEAEGWRSLAVMRFDLSGAHAVRAGGPEGTLLHPESIPAIANGGNLVVYSGQGGPHVQDLWAVSRTDNNSDWGMPVLLTGDSDEDYNENPAISADGTQVLFHCGPTPYGQAGAMAALINTDGTGYTILQTATSQPAGRDPGTFVRSPDFMPDGSYIFETDWDIFEEHRTWHQPLGGGDPVLVSGGEGANSPCVLPDGRIIHLWLGHPDNLPGDHELAVINPDGTNQVVLVGGIDIVDIGMGAGGS